MDDTGKDDSGKDDSGKDDTGKDDSGKDDTGKDDSGKDDTGNGGDSGKDDSGNTDKPDDKPEETKILTGEAEVASNEYGSVSGITKSFSIICLIRIQAVLSGYVQKIGTSRKHQCRPNATQYIFYLFHFSVSLFSHYT